MSLRRPLEGAARIYREYPKPFWTMAVVTFIDRLGGTLVFPFFALYVTSKFGVGMIEVGYLFLLFSVPSLFGGLIGGALTDRLGRKGVIIFSLVMTSLSTLLMGLLNSLTLFYVLAVFVGLLSDVGGPAYQAAFADILPQEKRAEGFGLIRVIFNLAVVIGPAVGGILAARSYLLLFVTDAIASIITASIVLAFLPETKPPLAEGARHETILETFRGYGQVARDSIFMFFILACVLQGLVYLQMNSTLGVYLRDVHGISTRGYGALLSLNAAMVVVMQFSITRQLRRYAPLLVMVAGTLLYALGFAMYGFTATYAFFVLAMVVITLGEMLVAPMMQALVASMAPEDMRGRYMAGFGFAWVIPGAIGPLLAGVVMDRFDPRWVWYAAGIIGCASAAMFLSLHRRMPARQSVPQAADPGPA